MCIRDRDYGREYHHLTLARVLIVRHRTDTAGNDANAALGLLERLGAAARAGGRTGAVIETLMLQGLALQALGDTPRALSSLQEALDLAGPAGYVRTFLDEGPPMRDLLRHAAAAGVGGGYARDLLAAFDEPGRASPVGLTPAAGLSEHLTARELEVLRLVAAGLQNQAIADHLVISLPTVKRHIANVYGKLDVGSRTAAVARASELKLI